MSSKIIILDWSSSAQEISRLCKAANSGPRPDSFLAAKMIINSEAIYIPLKCDWRETSHIYQPGEIISITDTSMDIAAQKGIVQIGGFLDQYNKECTPLEISARHNLAPKVCLPIFEKQHLKEFAKVFEKISSHEGYWLDQWKQVQPCQIPWKASGLVKAEEVNTTLPFSLQKETKESLQRIGDVNQVILSTILCYLSKINQKADFTVYYQNEQIIELSEEFQGLFSRGIPFNVQIKSEDSFKEIYNALRHQINQIQEHKSYSIDLINRNNKLFEDITQLPVALILVSDLEKVHLLPFIELAFIIDVRNQDIYIQSNDKYSAYLHWVPLQIEALINQVIRDEKVSLRNISLLTPEESTRLIHWNDTSSSYPQNETIHRVFEEQVEKTPEKIAVIFNDQQISYEALNRRANQLAHYLRKLGVTLESRVGIALPRGIELIVGILATLKAGAIYIPLDIEYPLERIAYQLEDSQVNFLLSLQNVDFPENYTNRILYLDQENCYADQSEKNLDIEQSSANLAYITYTSGSTGKPKGVACHHAGVINRLYWAWNHYRFKQDETCCLQSSMAFVDSTWDIFGTLLVGAKLVLYKEEISKDIDRLLETCFLHRVTRITLIPSFLNTMLNFSSEKLEIRKKYLSHWEITGESFQSNLISHFFKEMGDECTLLDCYGASEATSVIYREFSGQGIVNYQTKIISNTKIHIVDEHLNLVPIGVVGEIYIGGAGLARGYINKPDLTAERFIPSPFEAGSRLYKTGDLGRYLPDGNIEFLGRIDHQVKMRGFRVELGEIEATIELCKEVQQAIVLCREDLPGQKRLVAYAVVKNKEKNELVKSLQDLCESHLPDYMCPSQWVMLEHFPLTATGKIDRKALPAPEGREGLGKYEAPEGLIEGKLAKIWADLLGIEQISRKDDFIRLGGHSLLAIQMVSRLREALQLEVPLKAVFENRVLASLARYLEQSHVEGMVLPPVTKVSREALQPLSFAQQRLWFLEQLLPNTGLYHNPMSFRVLGDLKVGSLRQALNMMVKRHEILRTVIINVEGVALQKVLAEDVGFALRESAENMDSFINDPFQFDQEPACRGLLVKHAEKEHRLVLVFHHILIDDWSMDIFCKELNTLYRAYSEDKPLSLSPLSVQYIDYSVWQRNWLQGDVLEKQLAYWQAQLKELPRLELPTDYPRPKELSYQGGFVNKQFSKEVLDQIQAFSQAHGVTLFMTLLASVQGFLSRYCNQSDIAIGTPIANRRSLEVEGLIGFFVNTLVLRSQLEDNPDFDTLIKRVENTTLSAYDHQDVPFEQLVEYLQVPRELNRNPLFQVLFNLHHEGEKFSLGNLELLREETGEYLSRFDLLFYAVAGSDGLALKVDYSKELFTRERIEKLVNYYEHFLIALLKNPKQRLSEVPLLGEEEQEKLKVWNAVQHDYAKDKTIHQLFEEQVEKTPDNIAVIFEDQRLSYKALNEQANQLAHYLQKNGIGPESKVGIALNRSMELIVAIMAVLKSGAAYIPFDLNSPQERFDFMLEDSQIKLLLSSKEIAVPENYSGDVIYVDGLSYANQSVANSGIALFPGNLAYIIYTSGSTGRPKGVGLSHGNAVSYLSWAKSIYGLEDSKPVLFHGSVCFDMSITSLFVPLITGKPIKVIKEDFSKALEDQDLKESFSFIKLTPSHLKLIEESPHYQLKDLSDCFIVGGEAFTGAHLTERELTFYNEYGPTEATVACSIYEVDKTKAYQTIPIGKPIWNTHLHIVDEHLNLVPIGVVGEIYIGGAGLARGYINKPGLTAERFIPNPFESGSRLYKTGDLGRYLPDGNIEFLGRIDHQVKIRGYRVELGEIESCLMSHGDVNQAFVLLHTDSEQLIAYITPNEFIPEPAELLAFLDTKLPEYMIPKRIIILDALPLTANGKIDRQALPMPEGREGLGEYEAPEGLIEEKLAKIWADLLKVEKVSRTDNFFQIGGDSIVSIQLVSKARQQGMLLTVKQIFETPTLASLAFYVKEETSVVVSQEKAKGELPLSPIQDWYFREEPINLHHFNQAMWIKVARDIDLDKLQDCLKEIYHHHDGFRLRYKKGQEGWEQYYKEEELVIPFEVYEGEVGENLEKICTDFQASLNIEHGPLSRVVWFKERQQLFWVIHHMIVDGVSWRILLEDLNRSYQGKELGAKAHSYKDWVESLARYDVTEELAYYERELKEIPRLPTDFAYPHYVALKAVDTIEVKLSELKTRDFLQKAHQSYGTQPNDLLLLALIQAVRECFGQNEFCVDLEGHGREDLGEGLDLTRTLGWFTSMHPVVLHLPEAGNMDHSLKYIKEHLRRIPHKGAVYGILSRLQKKCTPIRADILFNYLGQWSDDRRDDEVFFFGNEGIGASEDEENPHTHLLVINGGVNERELCFSWSYSCHHYKKETIEGLAAAFQACLEKIVDYCVDSKHFGYTPSDFPLCHLSQVQVDQYLASPKVIDAYPLSPVQEGFFLHALSEKFSDAYLIQLIFELKGDVHKGFLKKAWQIVLERHESLRASFIWEDLEEPIQIISKMVELPWHEEDWSALSEGEQSKCLDEYIVRDRANGFDFNQAPLMRCGLFKLGNQKYSLLWSHHHILSDGWSAIIILNEVRDVYENLRTKKSINFLPIRRSYRDYIAWLNQQSKESGERYWREVLNGAVPTKVISREIITDKAQTLGESLFVCDEEVSRELANYAGKLGVTLNTVLQTLWGIVLSAYSGQKDVTFGVVISGRQIDLPGIDSMVGVFINTLPLRVQLREGESLQNLLNRIQKQMVGMQEHSYIPLWKVQSQQGEGHTSLFDSTYVYQNYPAHHVDQNADLEMNLIRGIEKGEYKLGINLSYDKHLQVRINYGGECFTVKFITQLFAHLEQLIMKVVSNPTQKVGELCLLKPQEAKQLSLWNETQHDEYLQTENLNDLFDRSVERVPDSIAVVYLNQQITYRLLNERSNQFAHYLRSFGVEAEIPVALAMESSVEMVVCMLAILKAGGVYVPLDVSYPSERLEYIIEDSGAPFVISRSKELKNLSLGHQIVINLDEIQEELQTLSTVVPEHKPLPNNLAYIIYTSGSTGRPKGVGVCHQSLAHLSLAQKKYFMYGPHTKTLQFASIGFDASISELGCTFAQGSTLVLCNNKDLLEVESVIARYQVDQITLPPSILQQMSPKLIARHAKWIVVAGETVERSLVEKYKNHGVNIINAYGPTEGTVCATIGTIDLINHIGRPIWNTQVHILDEYLNQVPIGAAGEIYIGGVGLARGYINQPGLTAERFIPNPFKSGARLYKTGDMGRYLSEGDIEFLGRLDYQIKLRGFRIELAEIEETINSFQKVQAIVLCKEDTPGQKALVAYVVPKVKEENALVESLQALCQSRMPGYMQPNQWVMLETFPLTINGKIDREALKNRSDHLKAKTIILYKNSLEYILCEIFKNILNLDEVGVENNFFDIGGNSLLAVNLVLNIKKELDVKIRIIDIFENPTVIGLSKIISQLKYPDSDTHLQAKDSIFFIQSEGKKEPLFLIHPGLGLSIPYIPLKNFVKDRPIIGIDDPDIGEKISGFKNVEDMASSYIKIIKNFQKQGPYHIGGYSFGGMVAHEVARQLEGNQEELQALILIEAANPELIQTVTFSDEEVKKEFEQKIDRNELLAQQYKPKPVRTKLSLIKAQSALSELTEESRTLFHDSMYGWDKYYYTINEYTVNGEHATIFEEENIHQLGNVVKNILEQQ